MLSFLVGDQETYSGNMVACALKANVGAEKHQVLRGAEAMAVGYYDDGAVASVLDEREKTAHLLLGEVGDGSVLPSLG